MPLPSQHLLRCFGLTSWRRPFELRRQSFCQHRARGQHTTAAASEQQTATAEAPKPKAQQQKKQAGQKGGKDAGKKSELAVTPKSEDFAR